MFQLGDRVLLPDGTEAEFCEYVDAEHSLATVYTEQRLKVTRWPMHQLVAVEAKLIGREAIIQQPLCLDLCGGLGGTAEGFLAAGYEVHGYDIVDWGYPGILHLQDVREVDSIVAQWQGRYIHFLWASPPCREFVLHSMPWLRKKNPPPPDMSVVIACFELVRRLKPGLFILENVRGAQPYIGRAPIHWGNRYLWGDVALIPLPTKYRKKEAYSGHQAMLRAKIPFDLAYGIAMAAKAGLRNTRNNGGL